MRMRRLILFILMLYLEVSVSVSSIDNTCNWPKECQLVGDYSGQYIFKCEVDSSSQIDFNANALSRDEIEKCQINKNVELKTSTTLEIRPVFRLSVIFRKQLVNFSKLIDFLNMYANNLEFDIRINYFTGFHVDLLDKFDIARLSRSTNFSKIIDLTLINSNIGNFYYENEWLETCDHFIRYNLSGNNLIKSIFHLNLYLNVNYLFLENCEYTTKVCPLIFENSRIVRFELRGLFHTFLK